MLLVETQRVNLKSMIDTDHLNFSINHHMKTIKENLDGEKIMKLFQIIGQHSVIHSGMSFMSNKTMAKHIKSSVRTVQRYVSKLIHMNILIKFETVRKKNKGQTSNTLVILPVMKSIVDAVCHTGCQPLNPSFKPLKQEKHSYIHTPEIEGKKQLKKTLMKYFEYKVDDMLEKETIIHHPSSYAEKVVKNEVRKIEARRMMFLSKLNSETKEIPRRDKEIPKQNQITNQQWRRVEEYRLQNKEWIDEQNELDLF